MIIGLTGSFCSGKDTVAEYLVKSKGFIHFSLSDVIREYMKKKKIPETRENLMNIGRNLRDKYGNSILAKKVLIHCKGDKNFVITSIRHPDEVKELRKRNDFYLINVYAPAKIRFKRMLKRNRIGDIKTFRQFLLFEKKESQSKGPGQQVQKCIDMADYKLENKSENLKVLYKKIDNLLLNLLNNK